MSTESFESQLTHDFEGHMGHYTEKDNFPCIFCSFETNKPLECLIHLYQKHNFAILNLSALSLLGRYLDNWRYHPQPTVPSTIYGYRVQTIDPENPEEINLRKSLHKLRLDQVMEEYELERTTSVSNIPCLFCKETFTGTWHQYLQWLFEVHHFNPGRPQNLVYIPDLVSHLRSQINNNICIHCHQHFSKPHLLRSNMKKKPHDKIPDSRFFDRFYMVNYLEQGMKWQDIAKEGDEDDSHISIEEGLKDFDDDTVIDETKCLICDTILATPIFVVDHMMRYHRFDLKEVQKVVGRDFYKMIRFVNYARAMKNQKKCFVCGSPVMGEYSEHIHSHDNKNPTDIATIVGDDKFLIPVIKEDPLLTVLEDL
ncbi:Zinc finger, C2H2 type family protein [Tritrichomonas foetus]|uniref:Zinc finger, C2H2 type family protein n=1 Tax=Tritrichomonas foetus TaxID=1144522 RepID=A0A1J4JY92_9EUKA|nr:Zinc finger, C2H2 type family protein [Tritrichomonas foetus]|eukprot:OHT03432.1 Zinc finger, C2H2 type family protein [Tritrichomonas foetus]